MSEQPRLPKVPSALIRLALADLAKVEADPRYVVDMKVWHSPRADERCHVCFAGTVIAGTLAATSAVYRVAEDFGEEACSSFYALNDFRSGYVALGIDQMGLHDKAQALFGGPSEIVCVTPHEVDPTAFRRDMNAMADMLESKGL